MLNKKTILIFSDKEHDLTATAIKEQLLDLIGDAIVIVIDNMELHSDAMLDYLEKVLKLKVNLDKRMALRTAISVEHKIDETPKSTNLFRNKPSYKKMENIFNRYTPDLVVTIGHGAVLEAIAVRDKLKSNAKVVSVVDEYALNRQLINTYIDGYLVENMAVKTTLVNNYVKEQKISLVNLPVSKSFTDAPSKRETVKELKLDSKLPVVLMVGAAGDISTALEAVKGYKDKYNIVVYVGGNRANYAAAQAAGLVVYNEGANLPMLYASADIVFTPPVSAYVGAALKTAKQVALMQAETPLGERNASYLRGAVIDASNAIAIRSLLENLTEQASVEYTAKVARFDKPEAGAELIKFIS